MKESFWRMTENVDSIENWGGGGIKPKWSYLMVKVCVAVFDFTYMFIVYI